MPLSGCSSATGRPAEDGAWGAARRQGSALAPAGALDAYAQPGRIGLVFVGEKGGPLRRCNFSGRWAAALEAVGLDDGVHFHDLRHSGNTWAARTGANLPELMRRMGHASSDAAVRYQRATSDRDRAIADALGRLADEQAGEEQPDRAEDDEGHDESS